MTNPFDLHLSSAMITYLICKFLNMGNLTMDIFLSEVIFATADFPLNQLFRGALYIQQTQKINS